MKRLLFLIGALAVSTVTLSGPGDNRGVHKFEFAEDPVTEYVECLGLFVDISVVIKGRYHEFFNANDGWHEMATVTITGDYQAVGSDMSWRLSQGTQVFVVNENANGQIMQIDETHEVALANGDYPNLLFSFGVSGTVNANGELVTLRITDPTYRCLPN